MSFAIYSAWWHFRIAARSQCPAIEFFTRNPVAVLPIVHMRADPTVDSETVVLKKRL